MSGSNNEITNTGGPASSTEPSMEEILASIRRILRDEQSGPVPEEAAEDEDILMLDSSMVVRPTDEVSFDPAPQHAPEPAASIHEPEAFFEPPEEQAPPHLTSELSESDFPAVDNQTLDLPFTTAEPEAAAHETAETATELEANGPAKEIYMSEEADEYVQPPHGLVGDAASNAAINSIGSLIRSISSERSIAIGRPGLTLEDLVREELRPLLKSWLDSNLPPLVERIVRAEIQRVVERTGI